MPAAYDIYANELRELRRGQPLYYPEPSSEEGPVEIGDVGYTRQGAFCRLFNVSRPADDPSQTLGVPAGFQPLEMGRILKYEAALEPGPLHSKTIFRVHADVETPGVILPASASFRFSCTSSRGAILMLETQMSRDLAFHDSRFKNYLLQNCLSWYEFARELGVQVDFGDVMLITECSKTAAWASAVYSQNSREFGMSFSAGGAFLPSAGGVDVSAGLERIGPVEYRRSQRRVTSHEYSQNTVKDHTVFVRAYRLGSRSLYLKSIARKIMKSAARPRIGDHEADSRGLPLAGQGSEGTTNPTSPTSLARYPKQNDSYSEVLGSMNVSAVLPEWPDFHPAVALLAHQMETTNVEIAAVHDEEWCLSYSKNTIRIIDDYARCFFDEDFRVRSHHPGESMFSVLQTDQISFSSSEDVAKFQALRTQGPMTSRSLVMPDRASVILNISALSFPSPTIDLDSFFSLANGRQTKGDQLVILSSSKERHLPRLRAGPSLSINEEKTWRIAILGGEGVGKSALAMRTYDPTLEAVRKKRLRIDQEYCYIEILDISSQASKKDYGTTQTMIETAQAFIFVFCVDSRASFESITSFYETVLDMKRKKPLCILAGNKIDRSHTRQVSWGEGRQLADNLGCDYVETSAKTAIAVQKAFVDLVHALKLRHLALQTNPFSPVPEHVLNTQMEIRRRHRSCIVM